MKVKELINLLKGLPQNEEITITAMDDHFSCTDFEVHSEIEDGSQEIIMNVFVDQYTKADNYYPETIPVKLNGNKVNVIDRLNKRLWVDRLTGSIYIGYKYGHGVRVLTYEDLIKLAWVLDYGNEINSLRNVNMPDDYPKEELIKEEKLYREVIEQDLTR